MLYQSNSKAISKEYQVDINPQICLKIPRNTKTEKKNFHAMLGNVNVLLQYNKNILLLLSAVYYRNYSLPWSCVVVAGVG